MATGSAVSVRPSDGPASPDVTYTTAFTAEDAETQRATNRRFVALCVLCGYLLFFPAL